CNMLFIWRLVKKLQRAHMDGEPGHPHLQRKKTPVAPRAFPAGFVPDVWTGSALKRTRKREHCQSLWKVIV
ncbi:MAG: hypothetical protein LIQ31_04560, partial [Planctomycetes bacterium]|nr:hypothetical protein [Planctomycetota bacterium]